MEEEGTSKEAERKLLENRDSIPTHILKKNKSVEMYSF